MKQSKNGVESEEFSDSGPANPSLSSVSAFPDSTGVRGDSDFSDSTDAKLHADLKRIWSEIPTISDTFNDGENRIGRFEIAEELGHGAYGVVFKAFDPYLGQTRAIKVQRLSNLLSERHLKRILAESKAMARLDHPNMVRVFETDRVGPVWYLVMEHCSAGSLRDWLQAHYRHKPVPPDQVIEIVLQICDGMAHAHNPTGMGGILHRDLKPSNILLASSTTTAQPEALLDLDLFRLKIAVFGLARFFEEVELTKTKSEDLGGTLPYMAPEQVRRGKKPLSVGVDIYAIGVILYELLTGRRPFSGSDAIGEILNQDPIPVRKIVPSIPASLERICRICLEKSPRDRYQSVGELAEDLRRIQKERPIRGRSSFGIRQIRHLRRRHPQKLLLSSLTGFALISSAAIWNDYARRRDAQEAQFWLQQVENASAEQLRLIIERRGPDDPLVNADLLSFFESTNSVKKRNAAVVLAPLGSPYLEYAIEELLNAGAADAGHLAETLKDVPGLVERLQSVLKPGKPSTDQELRDQHRANAALALIHLNVGPLRWDLLKYQEDPRARSILIHRLGPSGLDPRVIVDRLRREKDETIQRALILALGELPEEAVWEDPLRGETEDLILTLYSDHTDSGVHGAAKWILGQWNLHDKLAAIDPELVSITDRGNNYEWRIGTPLHLTFVRLTDPTTGRVIEIADTEVTVSQILVWQEVDFLRDVSPGPDYPINGITYLIAAEYLNWLSALDGIAPEEFAYQAMPKDSGLPPYIPVDQQLDRLGYRLPTEDEFEQFCRAGTITARYSGDSSTLLRKYAHYGPLPTLRTNPVGRLKPNDLGLFDVLGNVSELCQVLNPKRGPWYQVKGAGGSVIVLENLIRSDYRSPETTVDFTPGTNEYGFRIVRTIKPQQ